jgi:hypothetical protein
MKFLAMTFFILAGLIYFLGKPVISEQAHVEVPGTEMIEKEEAVEFPLSEDSYRVTHVVLRKEDEKIGDILWMQEAAELALEKGKPYFNVLERYRFRRYDPQRKVSLSVIEGIIELQTDPMSSEYDANEIINLNLIDKQPDGH